MKRKKADTPFIDQLRESIKSLKNMRPGEVHVLSINANYGHYQIFIGPESESAMARSAHTRQIEINGEIHHLFVTPTNMRPHPSRKQMMDNLKDTLIMRNLTIHLCDPKGDGKHLRIMDKNDNGLHAREYINLAGDNAGRILREVEHSSKMSFAAYRIVQKDILKALKKEEGKST